MIGLIGTEKGAGVTHTSLLLARYFSKQRGKVAVVEWGDQDAIAMIRRTYEGQEGVSKSSHDFNEPYVFRRVHYYEQGNDERIALVRRSGYQVVIVDFGEHEKKKEDMFNQMDMQLVVGRGNDWKYHKIEEYYQKIAYVNIQKYKDLILILTCGTKEEKRHLQQKVKGRIETVSFHKDPFAWGEKMKQEIEIILGV